MQLQSCILFLCVGHSVLLWAMPDTVTVGTWNVWKKSGQPAHWPSRRPAVIRTIQRLDTDILMLQEAHPLITEAILEAKPTYCTVQDEFPGWGHEGMILWDNTKWEEVCASHPSSGTPRPFKSCPCTHVSYSYAMGPTGLWRPH